MQMHTRTTNTSINVEFANTVVSTKRKVATLPLREEMQMRCSTLTGCTKGSVGGSGGREEEEEEGTLSVSSSTHSGVKR